MEKNIDIEIPQYFLCPISLQIMRDPVTTITGITYDRESIEQWLRTTEEATCPATKQPLPRDSDLTPNHMLRRLIQAWCNAHVEYGIDRIPTPKSPLNKSYVFKLKRNLNVPELCNEALKKLEELASENEKNRKCMAEAGVAKAMILFIIKGFKDGKIDGLAEALSILSLTWFPTNENKQIVKENYDLIQSMTWVLRTEMEENMAAVVKTHALKVLKLVSEVASSSLLEQLNLSFFKDMMKVIRSNFSKQSIKAALHVLVEACPWGRNRMKIIESGAVFELVEFELGNTEKKISELISCLLAQLCSCADGRAQLLKHAGAIAMISKRILRTSPATDDRSVHIFALITRFSATQEVLIEMLRVGAVSKLCMVLQADCEPYLKKKAREILRLHSNVWNNSPCIQVYLLTRHIR